MLVKLHDTYLKTNKEILHVV